MYKFLAAFFFFCCAAHLSSQITIEKSEFLYEFGLDNILVAADNEADIVFPAAGEDMLWDFTNLNFPLSDSYTVNDGIPYDGDLFPSANGVDVVLLENALFPGAFQQFEFYSILDESTFRTIGRVSQPLSLPLESITGSSTDSLVYPGTVNVYESPGVTINFPLNYNDVLEDGATTLNSNFLATAAVFGLDNTPGVASVFRTDYKEVNGWGKIRVIDPQSELPVEVPVLLVSGTTNFVDSIFLAGSPAPQPLLDNLNLVQGETSSDEIYRFIGEGFNNVLMEMGISDNGDNYAALNTDIIGYVSSLHTPADQLISIATVPNPAAGDFALTFDKANAQDWSFDLINMQGRNVHRQPLVGGAGLQQFRIEPDGRTVGAHVYTVRDETGRVVGSGKVTLVE